MKLIDNPKLMKEWDYKKNTLNPADLSQGSNKKVWWKCPKGHKYQATIYNRSVGQGCSICSNHQVLVGFNDLQSNFPNIAKEWNKELNISLLPVDVVATSTRKVWWICSVCGHSWQTQVRNRTLGGTGCPICAIEKIKNARQQTFLQKKGCIKDSLLIKEWHPHKNGNFTPKDFTPFSNKYAWWICHKCGYEWRAKISNRNLLKRGCPLCSNQVVISGKNDLATTHPALAKEWNFQKNGNLKPSNVSHGMSKKVWWICPKGHEYQATINHRSNGTGCPVCNEGRQTSFAEQAVFFYLKKIYPDAINRYKDIFTNGMELDIYIPQLKLGIEYDGVYYHKSEKNRRELRKYHICQEHGIKLVRLREGEKEENIVKNCSYDLLLHVPNLDKSKKALDKLIFILLNHLKHSSLLQSHTFCAKIDVNTERDKYEIRKYLVSLKKDSLNDLRQDLVEEWHPTKNKTLMPNMFTLGSTAKVWWKCKKCSQEWEATIDHRVRGTGCPKCGVEKVTAVKRKAIEMLDPKTKKVIATFISLSEASRKLKINHANICMVCKGQRALAGGYYWRYKIK